MSLRARLALIVGVVLTIVMLVVGGIVIRTIRMTLVDQIDEQVRSTAIRVQPAYQAPDGSGEGGEDGQAADPSDPFQGDATAPYFRALARFVYTPNGRLLASMPYGFSDNPRSPPQVGPFPSDALYEHINIIRTLPSVNGELNYRTLVQVDDNGNYVVTAAPLTGATEAVDKLTRTIAISALLGVLVAALVSWAMISRELRPVDRMIQSAAKIGEGELGRRVPEPGADTELGRLGRALNLMLGRIEESSLARERSETKLRQFVADAAHELRTPLTSMRGYAELYRQGALKAPERLAPAMHHIEQEGFRMARLLDELLLLARLDEHPGDSLEPVDLGAIVTGRVAALQDAEPERPVELDIDDGILVNGVGGYLHQLVESLLTNVRTHTLAGTRVEVSLKRQDGVAELRVKDEGPGISWEFQSRIFERFTREDPARTRATGGSGLGLAIVSALTEAHGGTVALESTPGAGATFVVRLPLVVEDQAPVTSGPTM